MPYKRYEVLLPIKYNDGTPVEPDKFTETRLELFDRFGGATFDLVPMSGSWLVETGQAQEEEIFVSFWWRHLRSRPHVKDPGL